MRLESSARRCQAHLTAVPRASVRVRSASCCRDACGRWRCRWSAHPLLVLGGRRVVGIGRRSSRCRPSRGGWSSSRCSGARVASAGARRRATIGWRRARTRSSGTCSGSGTRAARRGYATSIEQLVVGLAPVMGWGPVPRDRAGRARFVRAHRRSVQRWLDDLQAAGLVAHEPERDGDGLWWRTQIVLLPAPPPEAVELQRARPACARLAGARARAARAAAGGAEPGRDPGAQRGARIAHAGAARREARASPRTSVAAAPRRRRRSLHAAALRSVCGDLTHPFGAPPTSAPSLVVPETFAESCRRLVAEAPAAIGGQLERCRRTWRLLLRRARAIARRPRSRAAAPAARTAGTEEVARRFARGLRRLGARAARRGNARDDVAHATAARAAGDGSSRRGALRGRAGGGVRWGGCVRRGWRTATGWPWWWSPGPRWPAAVRPGRRRVGRARDRAL